MANTTTRQTIRTNTLKILNDTSTSQVFQTDVLNQLIEEIELEVAQSWKWQFLRQRQQLIAPIFSSVTTAFTTASVTIDLSQTTNYANTQAIYVMEDIIPYTGVSALQLTGVTGISVNHAAGQIAYPLIQLPADYHKLMRVDFGQTSTMSQRKFMYVLENDWNVNMFQLYTGPICTVLNDATVSYLLCYGHSIGDTITIQYQKKPATYTVDTDVSSFPNEYIPYICRMVAGQAKIFYDDDLDGMGGKFYEMARTKLLDMAKLYGEREQGMSRLVKTTYLSGPNRRGYYQNPRQV